MWASRAHGSAQLARHSILKKRSTNRGTHLASASTHEAMFAPCVLPVVARGAYVAPLRAGSSRRRPRPARSVRSRATVPVRSASSSAESDFDDLSDVTRDVLAFHAAERNGNGDRGRGGERTVPLESWAARYGWTVDAAERVLWQADVPLKSSIGAGDANPIGKNVRIVDAKSAYVGVWLAFVEADHVVCALLARERGDPNSTAVKGGGSMTKKQALDAASAQLATRHAASHPEGGGCIQRRSTVAAWGDVIRALRRRYRKGDDACPYALLTKKVKTRRVYRAVRAGGVGSSSADLAGWEIVLGALEPDVHHASHPFAVEDARERERGGFGVRAGIGASSVYTNDGGAAGAGSTDVANNIAARRAARAASWKRRVNATYELDRCDNPWADEDEGGACGRADEARRLAEAAEKRRRSRLGSW